MTDEELDAKCLELCTEMRLGEWTAAPWRDSGTQWIVFDDDGDVLPDRFDRRGAVRALLEKAGAK